MRQMQIMILLVAMFFLCAGGPAVMAADAKPAPAPISDETLGLQAQVLAEKAGRLEAEYRLTVGELAKLRAEIQRRAEAKKGEKKEGKK